MRPHIKSRGDSDSTSTFYDSTRIATTQLRCFEWFSRAQKLGVQEWRRRGRHFVCTGQGEGRGDKENPQWVEEGRGPNDV